MPAALVVHRLNDVAWKPAALPLVLPLRNLARLVGVASIGFYAIAPAHAQFSPARDVGEWKVAISRDQRGCFLTRSYDDRSGGTLLLLGLDLDQRNRLSVLNDQWSIQPKARMPLTFRLSNQRYPAHPVVGIESGRKRGFVTEFKASFPSQFAGSRFLHIDRGKVPVERLDLVGSAAAVTELRRCVASLAEGAAGSRDGNVADDIPADPFAPENAAQRKR